MTATANVATHQSLGQTNFHLRHVGFWYLAPATGVALETKVRFVPQSDLTDIYFRTCDEIAPVGPRRLGSEAPDRWSVLNDESVDQELKSVERDRLLNRFIATRRHCVERKLNTSESGHDDHADRNLHLADPVQDLPAIPVGQKDIQ